MRPHFQDLAGRPSTRGQPHHRRSAFDGFATISAAPIRWADPVVLAASGSRPDGAPGGGARSGSRSSRLRDTLSARAGSLCLLGADRTALSLLWDDHRAGVVLSRLGHPGMAGESGGMSHRCGDPRRGHLAVDVRLAQEARGLSFDRPAPDGLAGGNRSHESRVLVPQDARCFRPPRPRRLSGRGSCVAGPDTRTKEGAGQ